ncbi:hypothetical protein BGZ49_004094, partial [Haplosporangium sp. Z 27]
MTAEMTVSPLNDLDLEQNNGISNKLASSSSPTTSGSSLLEGGSQGWLAVLGSFLIHCFVFAPTEFVFGVFVLHYQEAFPSSPASAIAFVGTTGSAITYIAGFLSGILADRFGFRPTAFAGSVIMALSLIGASFSTQLWHLYVTQGVLFGVGASFTYYPAIAVPSQYFTKNRGLAIGVAVSGTGFGGFGLAPLTNALIESVDIYWTLRILGIMIFVVCGGASMLIVEKKSNPTKEQIEQEEEQERTMVECSKTMEESDGEIIIMEELNKKKPKSTFFQALHV